MSRLALMWAVCVNWLGSLRAPPKHCTCPVPQLGHPRWVRAGFQGVQVFITTQDATGHRNVFVLSVSEANALLGQLEGAADSAAATAAAQAHSRSVLAAQRGGLP